MAHYAAIPEMNDDQFNSYVMDVLARELGPAGYARCLMLHRSGPGDYTQERHKWQATSPSKTSGAIWTLST